MSSYLTTEQVEQILRQINPSRVSTRDGMAYVEAYEVRAHMARIFGVARWSSEVVEQYKLFEEQVKTSQNKDAWYVGWYARVKVTVCAPDGTQLAVYTEGHVGDSTHPKRGEANGNAVTNSESYAFKRGACMALLDQGGLSLYGKGSKAALVKRTLVMPDSADAAPDGPVDHDATPVAPEVDTDASPAPDAPAPVENPTPVAADAGIDVSSSSPEADVEALRERVLAAMDLPKQEAIRTYARLQLDIAKAGVQGVMVLSPAGVQMTLGALVSQALDFVSKPRQGNAHADAAAGEAVAS